MIRGRILVVDDDKNIIQVVRTRLRSQNFDVDVASNGPEALKRSRENHYDVMITDMKMPEMDGLELMRQVQALNRNVQAIVLTAYGTIDNAVSAMRNGAVDYMTKPFDSRELVFRVERALEKARLTTEVRELRQQIEGQYNLDALCAKSPKMRALLNVLGRIIGSDSTVLIEGESGTGKELVAKIIHYRGRRKDRRLVTVDCGATPENLLESELFGYKKGAFTDAVEKAKPVLLEPIVDMEITVPAENMGDITGDLASKRGRVMGQDMLAGNMVIIKAQVPLAEVSQYNSQLKSVTGGRGSYSMSLSHYEIVPANVQAQIVAAYAKQRESA